MWASREAMYIVRLCGAPMVDLQKGGLGMMDERREILYGQFLGREELFLENVIPDFSTL